MESCNKCNAMREALEEIESTSCEDGTHASIAARTMADITMKDEKVNHPPHYNKHPSGIECIDVVEHMNFNRGNAIKYIWRAGNKGSAIEDLEKAKWYIEREIKRLNEKD